MNRTNLKNYAPQARRDFIQAMTDRAAYYGLTATKTEPVVERGDVAVIAGRDHPRAVAKKRNKLEHRIKRHGFEETMEAMAYTWFNRLVAIRFMELHGFLEHGYRVLSHPEGKPTPEILEHAEHVDLPGLKKEAVIDLKLAGNKENELYRLLLSAQCNALHAAMPFLFEKIDDETELLLPDNLLHSDSLIRKLAGGIDEEDWKEVEIVGWLYQFYISEKKNEVIGKVVACEDIPAATQLFTPNWIVKYLVQNTLGRQWLATYPQSALRRQMDYYIEPADQTPEVQEQLKAITPTNLNPEEMTLLDPACGSGHILVEAYDLFKEIYQERGYRAKDIPALILHKNLFGLEIDDRAAQLAAFSLMMKARADDRRIFEIEATPNVLAFEDTKGMDAADITHALNSPLNKDDRPSEYLFEEIENEKAGLFSKKILAEKGHISKGDIASLLELFENAKTFGSLIQVPPKLAVKLPEIEKRIDDVLKNGDLSHISAQVIKPLLQQARLLVKQYDAVVANPPYIGNKSLPPELRHFAKETFAAGRSDLFAVFIHRISAFTKDNSYIGTMTPFTWMFISSYEDFRDWLLKQHVLCSLIQPEYHAFFESAYVPVCTSVMRKCSLHLIGTFIKLSDFYGEDVQPQKTLEAIKNRDCGWLFSSCSEDFRKIPGSPIAYWASAKVISAFDNSEPLSQFAVPRVGMITCNNERFLRFWHEVDYSKLGLLFRDRASAQQSRKKWFPYQKGGAFRRWFGNLEYVVNWENDGLELRTTTDSKGKVPAHAFNDEYIFQPNVNWSKITSGEFSARISEHGNLFDDAGSGAFGSEDNILLLAGFLNSKIASAVLKMMNPTLNVQAWNVGTLPIKHTVSEVKADIVQNVSELRLMAISDWGLGETYWGFQSNALSRRCDSESLLSKICERWNEQCFARIDRAAEYEEKNNRLLIDAYGLQDEFSPDVPKDQITLYRPDRAEDIKRLLSYAIGCMMGRYSLDKPGLIYARSGNKDFDPGQYTTFRADGDGIIPLLETDWGIQDDAANRIVEFVGVAWPKELLEENLKFIADSIGPNNGEQPRDTIRRYLATGFYKHHLPMYKKRPIYWLFSSGKQRAFQCLVYLHRYNEGTLARMRTEYVIPLQGQIAARIEQLEGDKAKATSTSHRNKLQKEQTDHKKEQAELLIFEEKLKHAADQKISLDLDDGVKVNYGKFGDLLAEVKAVCGTKDDE